MEGYAMYTVGSYLGARLSQIGLKHHFAVAGDYNLALLDELSKHPDLKQVYCSNELNCGFSAEGYARPHGAAAAVVTFSVGALLAFNAIGGAYAENLPVILISGAAGAEKAAVELADALGCSVAVMAATKSFFPEDHLVSVLIRASAIARVLRGCASTISGTCFSIVS
jgi:thiamine pyrophosphate-dependent acetolactate synthase large subunit-like protein